MKPLVALFLFLSTWGFAQTVKSNNDLPLKIWFNKPTTNWNEGLAIGNGSLGAMIY